MKEKISIFLKQLATLDGLTLTETGYNLRMKIKNHMRILSHSDTLVLQVERLVKCTNHTGVLVNELSFLKKK